MSKMLATALVAAAFAVPALHAQQTPPAAPATPAAAFTTMTGCVSKKPAQSGQYSFDDVDGLAQYRLTGKAMKKYAGQRVEIVGAAPSKGGLTIKGGLWPAPTGGARGVALDPAQEAVAIQQAHTGNGAGQVPEFKVSNVRVVPGACE
jgi:hypothetical protein